MTTLSVLMTTLYISCSASFRVCAMVSETQVFDSGDAPFLEWMKDHPDGYVLNTERRVTSTVTFLHRSGCHHLTGLVSGQGPDGYTQRKYIKVCSEDASLLLAWCLRERTNSGGIRRYCKTCNPPSLVAPFINYADEVPREGIYYEGACVRVTVNAYERNTKARSACLQHYGIKCAVCQLEFDKRYGEIGRGFIHVHHIVPLSKVGEAYSVDPVNDLVPVCPNCHSMLHRKEPPFTIEELRAMLVSGA